MAFIRNMDRAISHNHPLDLCRAQYDAHYDTQATGKLTRDTTLAA